MIENKDLHFGIYKKFFEVREQVETRHICEHSINFRMPKSMNELIDKDIEDIHKKTGIKISKNDFIIIMLMTTLNYRQSKENKAKFHRMRNNSNMQNFTDENRIELIERVKELLFTERMDNIQRKYTKQETKKRQDERIAERIENLPSTAAILEELSE